MEKELRGYKEYVLAVTDGRREDAKRHLLVAVRDAKQKASKPVIAGLMQRLADLLWAEGDTVSALAIYEGSEFADEGSLLAKLEHAKFLFQTAKMPNLARDKCQEILRLAREHPIEETADDFGSDAYIESAQRLMSEIDAAT